MQGELPLARNFASVTPATYDSDAAIFDMLMRAGAKAESESIDDHPLLAICKNGLSNFAQRGVQVRSRQPVRHLLYRFRVCAAGFRLAWF